MIKTSSINNLFFIFALSVLLANCASPQTIIAPTVFPPTLIPIQTITPQPSKTPTPTETVTPASTSTVTATLVPTETPEPTRSPEEQYADNQFKNIGVDPKDYKVSTVGDRVVGVDLKTGKEVYSGGGFEIDYVQEQLKGKLFKTEINGVKLINHPHYPSKEAFIYVNSVELKIWYNPEFQDIHNMSGFAPLMLEEESKSWVSVLFDQSDNAKYLIFELANHEVGWVVLGGHKPLKPIEITYFWNRVNMPSQK